MELTFQEYEVTGLERIFEQSLPGEQTADVIIPVNCPDVERIIDTFGTLVVQDMQLLPGGVSMNGMVQGGVLFVGEDETVHSIPVNVPVSVRKEFNGIQEGGTAVFRCNLGTIDARTVNSRKLLIRVGYYLEVEVYGPCAWKVGYLDEPAQTLQLRQSEYPLRIPTATGEKRFTVNEELELPESTPPVGTVLKSCVRHRIMEQRAVGEKGVFKTEFLIHLLYEDPTGKLCTYDWRIPLSQFVDLSAETRDGDLQTILHVTELELEPDSQIESRRLFLRVGVHSRCMVYETRNVRLIEDAYCTDGILEPRWEQWQCRPLLDSRILREETQWTGEGPMGTVVELWQWTEEGRKERRGDTLALQIPVSVSVLYYDGAGTLRGKQIRSMVETEVPLNQESDCILRDVQCTEVYFNGSATNPEIRIPVQWTADFFGTECLRNLQGGEILPLPERKDRRPSVILRRMEGEEDLWIIAKRHLASVDEIRKANALEDGPIPEGMMLLIPLEG